MDYQTLPPIFTCWTSAETHLAISNLNAGSGFRLHWDSEQDPAVASSIPLQIRETAHILTKIFF